MDYTQRYHLPQWIPSDRILMNDFNNAMSAIEDGMKANAAAASAAQTAANSAKSTAQTALSKAQTTFLTGKYIGNGSERQHITLQFHPQFLIIYGVNSTTDTADAQNHVHYLFMGGGEKVFYQVELLDDGFTVYTDPARTRYPILNEKNRTYEYIAFR